MLKFFSVVLIFSFSFAYGKKIEYVKFNVENNVHWGVKKGEVVRQLHNAPWISIKKTGKTYKLKELKLLPPVSPTKVIAVGLNYKSHSGNAGAAKPELFAKFPSSLQTNGIITVPKDASSVHYEGELVIVIGKKVKNISENEAKAAIFGILAGNDLSERNWQFSDLQWVRGKAIDGFAPISSALVSGVDYSDLMITTKVNGVIKQKESTKNLLHSPEKIVSWTSRYITLEAGDVIFTGTPGQTESIKNGDLVEVTIDKVGTLSNQIIWEK